MQKSCFTLVVAFILGFSFTNAKETYHVEKLSQDEKDIIEVKNSEGKVLAEIDVHADDGYQIIKPNAEDNVCLVFPFYKKEIGQFECYKTVPFYSNNGEDDEKLADCGDREILFFQREDCPNVKPDDNEDMRKKRLAMGCYYKEELVTWCAEYEKYCSKYGWWTGSSTCKKWRERCIDERAEMVRTIRCL